MRSRCHVVEVHIFDSANISGFATREFTTKENLNPPKQVFSLSLRHWQTQKPRIWSIAYGKIIIYEKSVV